MDVPPPIDKQVRPVLGGLFMVRGRKGVGKGAKSLKGHYVDLKKKFKPRIVLFTMLMGNNTNSEIFHFSITE